jgi:hypothetical protein
MVFYKQGRVYNAKYKNNIMHVPIDFYPGSKMYCKFLAGFLACSDSGAFPSK